MPSLVVTADDEDVEVAAVQRASVIKVKSLLIDNVDGNGDRVIRVRDIFTTDVSHGATADTFQITRLRYDVQQGDQIAISKEDLEALRILGALNIISDVEDTDCHITVGYDHE